MIGQEVGSYIVVEEIGRGAMGTVYRARHRYMDREAALKVLSPELSANSSGVQRFLNEARAASKVRHPGVVQILDSAMLPGGQPYIVMELLEGETLAGYLSRGGAVATVTAARKVGAAIAAALGAAHARGIIHRDLKPENIFLAWDRERNELAIKVLDFGVAKLMHESNRLPGATLATMPGSILGTPTYMSPEQCRGLVNIDPRSDLYSLGCVLFEMLVGRPPFVRRTTSEMMVAHIAEDPPALSSLGCTVTDDLDDLVGRLLSKSPERRPSSAADVCLALDAPAGRDTRSLAAVLYEQREAPHLRGSSEIPGTTPPAAGRTLLLPPSAGGTVLLVQERHRSTTLSQTTGEVSEAPARAPAGRKRKGLIVGLTAAASAATLAIAATAWRGRPVEPEAERTPPALTRAVMAGPAPAEIAATAPPPTGTTPVAKTEAAAPIAPQAPALREDRRQKASERRSAGVHAPAKQEPPPAASQTEPQGAREGEQDLLARPLFDSAESLIREARQAYAKRDCRTAHDLAERASRFGNSPGAYQILVACSCRLGDIKGAVSAYSRLAKPDRGRAHTACLRHGIDLNTRDTTDGEAPARSGSRAPAADEDDLAAPDQL